MRPKKVREPSADYTDTSRSRGHTVPNENSSKADEKPEKTLDAKALYTEGCLSLRHYSNCVLSMRAVTLAQGLVLLTASAYAITQGRYLLSFWISAFGLLFTLVLHSLHASYWHVFDVLLPVVVRLETDNSGVGLQGPWHVYNVARRERYENRNWKISVRYGPSLLLVMPPRQNLWVNLGSGRAPSVW